MVIDDQKSTRDWSVSAEFTVIKWNFFLSQRYLKTETGCPRGALYVVADAQLPDLRQLCVGDWSMIIDVRLLDFEGGHLHTL